MSNLALLPRASCPETTVTTAYLGPAAVARGGVAVLEAELPSGACVEAHLALAFSYEAAVGDTVLLLGNDQGYYVVGVLASRGKGLLSFPGDLELRAGGQLRLSADAGVGIDGPRLDVSVDALSMVARTVVQRFQSLRQRVAELLSVHAGSTDTVVEGASRARARSTAILSEDKVTINGKAIHLG